MGREKDISQVGYPPPDRWWLEANTHSGVTTSSCSRAGLASTPVHSSQSIGWLSRIRAVPAIREVSCSPARLELGSRDRLRAPSVGSV